MKFSIPSLVTVLASCMLLSACATTSVPSSNDPLESFNRGVFTFNEAMDTVLLEPVAKGYRYVTPEPARKGVRNALRNMMEPVNALNAALQGDITQFFTTSWRFVLNSTFGFAGLYDFASEYGNLPYRQEDFGQTLAVWTGAHESTYLVLPFIGPSNLRDAVGFGVDIVTNPWFYTLEDEAAYSLLGAEIINRREQVIDPIDQIYDTSFDPYSSFKSAYEQRRKSLIVNRNAK